MKALLAGPVLAQGGRDLLRSLQASAAGPTSPTTHTRVAPAAAAAPGSTPWKAHSAAACASAAASLGEGLLLQPFEGSAHSWHRSRIRGAPCLPRILRCLHHSCPPAESKSIPLLVGPIVAGAVINCGWVTVTPFHLHPTTVSHGQGCTPWCRMTLPA